MYTTSEYQINELYLVSGLSIIFVSLFTLVKFHNSWSREIYLVCLMGGWMVSELVALTLYSLRYGRNVGFPRALENSIHTILGAMSFWGVAIIQVS
jgi:hypothetical protein